MEAEEAGWDGVFLWDHMIRPAGQPQELADAWIVLAAVAAATERRSGSGPWSPPWPAAGRRRWPARP